jgi:hypothetical protein
VSLPRNAFGPPSANQNLKADETIGVAHESDQRSEKVKIKFPTSVNAKLIEGGQYGEGMDTRGLLPLEISGCTVC